MLGGCDNGKHNTLDDAQAFLELWFEQAATADSALSAPTCHGYGELMFPSASCEDMYGHAQLINPASRSLDRINALDCFGRGTQRVCGDFVEIWYRSADASGRAIKEGAVVKRDDGKFRLYWYRSDLLFTTLELRAEQLAKTPDPHQSTLQSLYNLVVSAHPELYQYAPCLEDIRVSSSTMIGVPLRPKNIQPSNIQQRAANCSIDICFAAVGQKLATLCPR